MSKRRLVVISVDCSKLPKHTLSDFKEWVKYKVGETPLIALKNPLYDEDIRAIVREVSL